MHFLLYRGIIEKIVNERKLMQMKKVFALILAIMMLMTLCACDRPEKPLLRVAMSPDFPPMEFLDESKSGQDRFVGFDVSLARYLADGLGMELEIVPMSFEECQSKLESGDVDMAISGFSWLPDRAERFNLSDTYRAGNNGDNQLLLVRADLSAALDSPAAFAGLRIGAQAASLQEWLVSDQLPDGVRVPFEDLDQGLALLLQGGIDAMAVAEGNAVAILAAQSDLAMAPFRFAVSEELTDNLILLKKGDAELTEAVNDLLAKAEAEGYYSKWYAQALQQAGISVEEPATE